MAIVNNTVSELNDTLIIQVQVPILGIVLLSSFIDDTKGETVNRYFNKIFRYSVDGINFSEWLELTNENVSNIQIKPTNLFKIEYRYTRSGLDNTGLLQFNKVSVNGQYQNLEEPSIYSKSIFAQFFGFWDISVLSWALNVLEKVYNGIVPKYIERDLNNNDNKEDQDYIEFWLSITHYFAIFVRYVRLFQHIESNKTILFQYLKSYDLYINDDISLEDAIYLMNNIINEIRQRGTIQIALEKQENNDESSSSLLINEYIKQVDGELLRLIGKKSIDEFLFCSVEPWKVGWFIDQGLLLYRGIDFYNANKNYEKSESFIDLSKYPLINSQYIELVDESDIEGIMKISGIQNNEISGIGLEGYIYVDPIVYYNEEQSQEFQRDDCGIGYVGSMVTYTVSAGTYSSLVSQEAANNKALKDIEDNGQTYANSHGFCIGIYPIIFEDSFSNWTNGLPTGWTLPIPSQKPNISNVNNRLKIVTPPSEGQVVIQIQNLICNQALLSPTKIARLRFTVIIDEISLDSVLTFSTSFVQFPDFPDYPWLQSGTYIYNINCYTSQVGSNRVINNYMFDLVNIQNLIDKYCIISYIKIEQLPYS